LSNLFFQEVIFYTERLVSGLSPSSNLSVCLTGGRSASVVYKNDAFIDLLNKRFMHVYFGDERCVPADHPSSNYRLARQTIFLEGIPESMSVHRIDGESCNLNEEAERYASLLPSEFDLIMLSVGEDGHIASLFPGGDLLTETKKKVAPVLNASKLPSKRITITPPVIVSAKNVIVMAAGREKGKILAQALKDPLVVSELPVRLTIGRTWVLDELAIEGFLQNKPESFFNTRINSV